MTSRLTPCGSSLGALLRGQRLEWRRLQFQPRYFRKGIRTTVFKNAPAGLIYRATPASSGTTGLNKQWWNLSPRVGVAGT